MRNQIIKIIVIAGLCLFAGGIQASPPLKSDEPMVEVSKEKRKKAGDECKTSSDCRRHYRCEKSGAWNICVPPEMKEIPKT